MPEKEKVYLGRCDTYNLTELKRCFEEGLDLLGVHPEGRMTIKPNCVLAHPKAAPHAYTRPEFLDALLTVLETRGKPQGPIRIVERSGARISTKRQFKRAGYYTLRKKHAVKLEPMENAELVKVKLKNAKLHDEITVAKSLVDTDFLIYTPKFKFNILVNAITGALKLNIGILDDEERMMFHDFRLDQKIVDLYEVGKPHLIAVDAITAGHGGSQLTSQPYPLGLVIMGTNSLAVDVVSNAVIGLDAREVGHLVETHERGYGPIDLSDIELVGEELEFFQERAKDFDRGFVRVDKFKTSMNILIGDGYADGDHGYCMGGCHGITLDALLMAKDRNPHNPMKARSDVTLVIGKYEGDVTAKTVIFVGDCSEVKGTLKAKRTVRVKGCPPTHRDLLVALALDAGLYPELLRMSITIPQIPYMLPKFLTRIHRPQAWKTNMELLKHW